MSELLREALTDLTDRPVPPPPASDALWRRGRRRHRARQIAATAVAFAVVAVGGSWWTGSGIPGAELGPVDAPSEQLRIPDALPQPDGWTRSIAQSGAPGPLSVIAKTETRDFWLRSEERWFGVSGRDQTYRWLDLPGMAEDESAAIALSPDGRYLGYHLGGRPSGAVVQSDIVGFAVYDTATGEVTERKIPTNHGLSVDSDGLTWSANSTYLVTTYGQYHRQIGGSHFAVTESWQPSTGSVQPLSALDDKASGEWYGDLHPAENGLWTWIDNRMVEIDPANGALRLVDGPRARSRILVPGPPVLNLEESRLAYIGERRIGRASYNALYVADLADDGSVGRHRFRESRWRPQQVQGWADSRTALIAAIRFPATATAERHAVLAWDVAEDSTRMAIQLDKAPRDLQLAGDALRNPFVDVRSWQVPAPPPLVALVGVAGLFGAGLWRLARRHRPGSAEADRSEGDE